MVDRARDSYLDEEGYVNEEFVLDYVLVIDGLSLDEIIEDYIDTNFYCRPEMVKNAVNRIKYGDQVGLEHSVKLNRQLPEKIENLIQDNFKKEKWRSIKNEKPQPGRDIMYINSCAEVGFAWLSRWGEWRCTVSGGMLFVDIRWWKYV
jgi:hypothetical protein